MEIGWKEAEKEEEKVEWENEVDEGGKEDDKEKEEGGRIEGAHGLTGDDFNNRSVSSI